MSKKGFLIFRDNDNNNFVNSDGTLAPISKYPWKSGRPDASDSYRCGLMYNSVVYDWDCGRSFGVSYSWPCSRRTRGLRRPMFK